MKQVRNRVITVSGTNAKIQHLQVSIVYLQAHADYTINVIIIPKITNFPYFNGLNLAHPVSHDEDFEVSILIGADYF